MERKKDTIIVRVSPRQRQLLELRAEQENMTLSVIIRDALDFYLDSTGEYLPGPYDSTPVPVASALQAQAQAESEASQ